MKKSIIVGAVALMSMTSFALAQTSTTPSTTSPASPPAVTMPSASPSAPSTISTGPAVMIPRQESGQMLSSKLIGSAVYGTTGDKIGDVDDVVIDGSGKVVGVVVGVGGFLGMGEKKVAIAYPSLTVTRDAKGATHVAVNVTKDALKAAVPFVAAGQS